VDDAGKLEFRKDIYGRDATMIGLLKNGGRRDLETVVAHSQPSYKPAGPVNIPGDTYAQQSSGPNFFERLFGVTTTQAPPPQPVRARRVQR
jgi:hypothetical protein